MLTELSLIHPLVQLALKATILLVATAFATVLLRRRSAAVRHLLWLCCAIGLLVLPLLTVVLPSLQLPLLNQTVDEAEIALFSPDGRDLVGSNSKSGNPATGGQPSSLPSQIPPTFSSTLPSDSSGKNFFVISSAPVLALIWVAGTALLLASRFAGDRYLSKFIQRCHPVEPDQHAASVLAECAGALGLRKPVLLTSESASLPFACRHFRSTIILPDEAQKWDVEKLRPVLMHELAHIKRLDCLTQFIAQCARALFWFHPLAWWMTRQMNVEREIACDDIVLRAGHDPTRYGKVLLRLATEIDSPGYLPTGAIPMASKSTLERRLLAMLDPMKNRGRVSLGMAIVALGTTALAAASLAVPQVTRQVPESDTELACQPHKLRPLPTAKLIRVSVNKPYIPWPFEELQQRAERGQLTSSEGEAFMSAIIASIRNDPSQCDSALPLLQEFIRTLKEQQLVSDEKILDYLRTCLSAPKLNCALHVHATDRAILLVPWRNVSFPELFGFVVLNEMKSITIDGKPAEIRSEPETATSSMYHADLRLPSLAPGMHIIRSEMVTALVAKTDTAGLSGKAPSETWPPARLRFERAVETDLMANEQGAVIGAH